MPNNSGQFSCAETPLNVNPTLLYNEAEPYYSYFGKFNSPEVGPMILKVPTNGSGLIIEENNQNSFSKNGVQYSLVDCRLYAPGLHNVLGTKGVAELCMFFQNVKSSTPSICVCVPIYVDDVRGASYFSQLRKWFDPTIPNRQPLGSLFTFGSSDAIEYTGADIRFLSINNRRPSNICQDNNFTNYLTLYTVLKTPIYIKLEDFQKFASISEFAIALVAPVATIEFHNNFVFKQKFVRLCKDIQFTFKDGKTKKQSALKCYNIDPTKDVGPDGIINLSKAKESEKSIDETIKSLTTDINTKIEPGLSMSSIEVIIAIVIAVIAAIIILGLIGYGVFKYLSKKLEVNVNFSNVFHNNVNV
jgi:hypothetical protein